MNMDYSWWSGPLGFDTVSNMEAGDMVLFHKRIAELVIPSKAAHCPGMLKITDCGGIDHFYPVKSTDAFEPLIRSGETILDAINRSANQVLRPHEELKREAERWLADPQPGDLFFADSGFHLEIMEIWDNGVIIVTLHLPAGGRSFQKKRRSSYDNVEILRTHMEYPHYPFYRVSAYATDREDTDPTLPLRRKEGVARYAPRRLH